MKPLLRWILAPALALCASVASAEFHTYQIEQIFSNASGTVQFIVLHESQGSNIETFLMGHKLTSTVPMSYTFPNNLPMTPTAFTRVLIATEGFAALGIVTPDYVIPNGFIPVGGGTINYAGVDQVTFGPLPTDGVTAINRGGGMIPNSATNFAGQSASVVGPAAGIDLNQYGLTGSYFQQTTSGQGVEVEVTPDHGAPGTAFVFVSWFTYDVAAGGADHQRWYTAQGTVASGQPSASLTMFQNASGNFVTPTMNPAQAVGTATLSFDTCDSGKLTYTFTDGSGRTGTITLTRLTQDVTCSTTAARPTNPDFVLSGNWYDLAVPGQGLTMDVNPNSHLLFAAWYTYMPNGAAAGAAGQRWYTAQGNLTAGMRSIPVQIFETTGGIFDTPTPAGQHTVQVGSGTIAFQSCSAATFNYNFTGGTSSGLSGTINLSRLVSVPPGCS